jgi:hypothetical protein
MPSQSSQSGAGQYWNRGFSPLFRGPYSDQHVRVSDAERQAVADRLAEHFAAGRLDQAEFDERVGRAMNAKTRADLGGLFDDLPETGAPATPGRPRRMRRRGHPVLVLVLAFVLALTVGHALFWAVVPLLWLGLLVAAGFLATRAIGRTHAGQDR